MTPAEQFYTFALLLMAGVVAIICTIVGAVAFLVHIDRKRKDRDEWRNLTTTVDAARADFWTDEQLNRLRAALADPHALDSPETEYHFAAWKKEIDSDRRRSS